MRINPWRRLQGANPCGPSEGHIGHVDTIPDHTAVTVLGVFEDTHITIWPSYPVTAAGGATGVAISQTDAGQPICVTIGPMMLSTSSLFSLKSHWKNVRTIRTKMGTLPERPSNRTNQWLSLRVSRACPTQSSAPRQDPNDMTTWRTPDLVTTLRDGEE